MLSVWEPGRISLILEDKFQEGGVIFVLCVLYTAV